MSKIKERIESLNQEAKKLTELYNFHRSECDRIMDELKGISRAIAELRKLEEEDGNNGTSKTDS